MKASDYCSLSGRAFFAGMLSYQNAQLGVTLRGRSNQVLIPFRQILVGRQLELWEKSTIWFPVSKKV
jgi:hypothetical protein